MHVFVSHHYFTMFTFRASRCLNDVTSCMPSICCISKRTCIGNGNEHRPSLNLRTMNHCIRNIEFSLRGPILQTAMKMEKYIKEREEQGSETEVEESDDDEKISPEITEIIRGNIGDMQAMGQKPLTFARQLIAAVMYPCYLNSSELPLDVKCKALDFLQDCRGKTSGSATCPLGLTLVRRHVAEYIERRDDGISCSPENVVLTSAVSDPFRECMQLLSITIQDKRPGVLIPVPYFPLYISATTEFRLQKVFYHLEEHDNWAIDREELKRAVCEARKECNPIAVLITNPGNPTGHVLQIPKLREIVRFAYKEKLIIVADEVYQDNVYNKHYPFVSFKSVIASMKEPFNCTELISLNTCSKGLLAEAGYRGGYMEFFNIDPKIVEIFKKWKLKSGTSPPIYGQVAVEALVNPPVKCDPSFKIYNNETKRILTSLQERADIVVDKFKEMNDFILSPIRGAIYAYPRICLPQHIVTKANFQKMYPDVFYCYELLRNTGILVVPGFGFGNTNNTYHFRTTILPPKRKLQEMLDKIEDFHEMFVNQD